jgi:hypothetical protein
MRTCTHRYKRTCTHTNAQRHVMGEGLAGQWEMLSVRYTPPLSLYGESALKTLQSVWSNGENFMGRPCGLGFLFVYALLQGQTRCKVVTGGYTDWWWGDSMWGGKAGGTAAGSGSDSHRLGVLLTQLYDDRHSKSVSDQLCIVMVCVCVCMLGRRVAFGDEHYTPCMTCCVWVREFFLGESHAVSLW